MNKFDELPLVRADCDPAELSATDLLDEVDAHPDQDWQAAKYHGCPNTIEVLYNALTSRAGVCLGGDSAWTDCDDLEDGLRRVIDGDTID